VTSVRNICGDRVYRYTAPALTGIATGWQWSFVGTLGSNAVVDSGSLTSQVVRMKFTMNTAAARGDSARVAYTSNCGTSPRRALKLTNTSLNCKVVKTSGANAANRTSANMVEIPFNVKVYPNPSMGVFNIEVQSPDNESLVIKVIDMQGRLVNSMKANPNTNIKIGWELRPGIYFLEVTQAGNKKYIKLLKD
jgi:hypothetical protein